MTPSSTFPTKYVDRQDVDYQKVPWYHFILIPRKEGSSPQDYIQRMEDLQSALEIKQLGDSAQRFDAHGRELTIEFLKEEVARIMSANDDEWLVGCSGLFIIHHPCKQEKLISAMANLLKSPRGAGSKKLLSVQHGGRTYCLEVELQPNNHMSQDGLILGLINPVNPAVVRLVERDRREILRFSNLYASKENMEWSAFESLRGYISFNFEIPLDHMDGKYEPLGKSTYPDFELSVEGQEWAIEVARIESGMTSYVEIGRQLDQRGFNRAFENHITDARVENTLREEIRQKSKSRADCPAYSRHCLLLVDIVDGVGDKGSRVWEGCDLSAFDAVALIRMDGSVDFFEGQIPLPSIPAQESNDPTEAP